MIRQGDIYWVEEGEAEGSEPAFRHPEVVLSSNRLNASRIQTCLTATLTTTQRLADAPGNVLLEEGEANLARRSVVNVTQFSTRNKDEMGEYIGTLTKSRVREILRGLALVTDTEDAAPV